MNEFVQQILEAACENCKINDGDWGCWENADHLIETYDMIHPDEGWSPELIAKIQCALDTLKSYEKDQTEDGLTRAECADGEVFLYKTPWEAWLDRDGSKPWLACGRTK